MELRGVTFTVPSADFDRSRDFYAAVLGFAVDVDAVVGDARPTRRVTMRSGGVPGIHLEFRKLVDGHSSSTREAPLLCFTVRGVEEVRRQLRGEGTPIAEAGELPYGEYLVFRDPTGNFVYLFEAYDQGDR